jgi:exosortase D (VPLPA-CTERM-specific)
MKTTEQTANRLIGQGSAMGVAWMALAIIGAGIFFLPGIEALLTAWQLPEYSHGPLIPILSGFMFLRQLKTVPINAPGYRNRWPGIWLMVFSFVVSLLGLLAHISDIVAYAMILWIGGLVLVTFGWKIGRQFWPPVLHLCFMLPLPGLFYYKVSTTLQFISSELGVWFLQLLQVPVFLDGNIIDLGIYQLHVAEACSGLRYLFPIMSFSYIFAVLYKGPSWHKAVLLISAAPIAVLMNSVRIAMVGVMVNNFGLEYAVGLSHLLEGWVVFLTCILILFGLARLLLALQPVKMSLGDALDLDLSGMGQEIARIRFAQPSTGMIAAAVLAVSAGIAWEMSPQRALATVERQELASFPRIMDEWRSGPPRQLDPKVAKVLGADDYLSLSFENAAAPVPVEIFIAWYRDQTKGGIHSPEVCLPGGGWEMASIKPMDIGPQLGLAEPLNANQVIIQKGQQQILVYYWFDQAGKRITGDFSAKAHLLWSGIVDGRTDGALVRFTSPLLPNETIAKADERMMDVIRSTLDHLPKYVPGA